MGDWLKEKGRLLGTIGAALAATLVDFQSTVLSDAFDGMSMVLLLIMVWPKLTGRK
jgi:hypothetical protein